MAINVKNILASGLLVLVEKQPLEKITVQALLDYTGVSRQSFYNHFIDKNDLIQYIYLAKIIPDYHDAQKMDDFAASLLTTFRNIQTYHRFMKQACLMEGQNCLKDFIFEHCEQFDMAYHQRLYGDQPMPEALVFATRYHANASSSMTLSWILSDMPVSPEEMAELMTKMRAIGMEQLFHNCPTGKNPYRHD